MKKLINITYSVQYEQVLELEINEENLKDLQKIGRVIYDETENNCYEDIFSYNLNLFNELEIPEDKHGACEYVDYCVQIKDYTGEIYLDIINDDTNESVFQEADNFYEDDVLYQTSVELNDIYWTLFITLDCSINKIKKIPFGESYEI